MSTRTISALILGAAFTLPLTAGAAGSDPARNSPTAQEQRTSSMNFERLDKNSDGYVSRDEARGNKNLESGFKGLDKNNDGKLSRSELGGSSSVGSGTGAGTRSQQPDADRSRPVAPREPATVPGPRGDKDQPTKN
jgi:hypothetical protein